jgi:hypothetical protein
MPAASGCLVVAAGLGCQEASCAVTAVSLGLGCQAASCAVADVSLGSCGSYIPDGFLVDLVVQGHAAALVVAAAVVALFAFCCRQHVC